MNDSPTTASVIKTNCGFSTGTPSGSDAPVGDAPVGDVAELGFCPQRFARVLQYLSRQCDGGTLPAVSLCVSRNGRIAGPWQFGKHTLQPDSEPLRTDAIFLTASITKPVVAMAVLAGIEQGLFSLDERVERFVPEFGRNGMHVCTLRHLLTHTSGLPDQVPNNVELRSSHGTLPDFVQATCQLSPAFSPGQGVQYSSMGYALLGEIIQRTTGRAMSEFLHGEFFAPLGLRDTTLGAPDDWYTPATAAASRIPEIRLPEQQAGSNWGWTSRYWQQLGAPWGGLLTTPVELTRLAIALRTGKTPDGRLLLSPRTVQAARENQLTPFRGIPLEEIRCRPWGFGWRLNWPAHSACFGDLLSSQTFGHWGATGTLLWIDPQTETVCVLLSTDPAACQGGVLTRASNLIAAAILAD